jgi:hypothetical protein
VNNFVVLNVENKDISHLNVQIRITKEMLKMMGQAIKIAILLTKKTAIFSVSNANKWVIMLRVVKIIVKESKKIREKNKKK